MVAWATTFGIAQAQYPEPTGTVQLGQPVFNGGQPLPPAPSGVSDIGNQPIPRGTGYVYGMTQVDRLFAPRVNIDSRGGGLYGYQAGYSNIGVFAPYKLEEDAIVFIHGMGLITYDGRGGATVGTGWRYYMENIDRIAGLSVWFDFDNGHAQPYQQVGLSFESLGRYVDYRINGYIPISNADHVLYSQLSDTAILNGNGIGLLRNNTVEQSYTGFDAEMGGPTPILGQYGLNAYIGGYWFNGNGQKGGDTTGVSGRLLSQINEDISFGVQVTNDHLWGLNTQFQVFANLPDGKPSHWFRNLRVRDRLVANVFRQNRVMAKTASYQTIDAAIDPTTHRPYFVANINPNLGSGTVGNGSVSSPYGSISQYEMAPIETRKLYDIILVQPRSDSKNTNLDTYTAGVASTLQLFDGQHLWSTSSQHTFLTENLPGVSLTMPGYTGGSAPQLFNSNGSDVITLVGGNTRNLEVSGFSITGSATGNGIYGNNNLGVNLNNNTIQGGLNGVLLTNLMGSFNAGVNPAGTELQLMNNTIINNINNGVQVTNSGSPPAVTPLDVVVQGNTFTKNGYDGLQLLSQSGGTIGGIIGGPGTSTSNPYANTFSSNGANGLDLIANGGTLNFGSPAVASTSSSTTTTTVTAPFGVANNAFGIYDNIFTSNTLDGLHINTKNNSNSNFLIVNNSFGLATLSASGNQQYGIGLVSDSGVTNITIGGTSITNSDGTITSPGNVFSYNVLSAISLAVGGTGTLNYEIGSNTITNGATATTAAPHDSFTFSFNGTSGTDPFTITNTSDPGVLISSVVWNLAGTSASIAKSPINVVTNSNPVVVQPIADTLLTSVNGVPVVVGSSPLLVSATNGFANNAGTGLAAGSQLLPLGFTGFAPKDIFNATALFEQNGGNTALTSASTNNSLITVNFSNGLSTTQKVTLVSPTGVAVAASGDIFGASTPGYGTGIHSDGIHVIASGNSTTGTSNIHDNTVSGYGNYGIHIETAGSASSKNVIINNNTVTSNGTGVDGSGTAVFSGGGIDIARADSSTLSAYLASNSISQNFNNGLVLSASGTSTGSLDVYTRDNSFTNNAANGLNTNIAGAAILNYTSNRDVFNGNGFGSGKNLNQTGGDNISFNVAGTAVANVNLYNVVSKSTAGSGLSAGGLATGSGLSATTSDNSTLNLLIESPTDPLFTGTSSLFSNNKVNGIVLNSMDTSFMHVNIYDTQITNNPNDGILFNRMGASLVLANITDSSISGNGVNGLHFIGSGSDPQNPNQQFSGTPNRINLLRDTLNNNGTNGVGQGARLDLLGDSLLVLNANATTFDSNAQNGIRVALSPGASFGYELGNERSTLDNVDISNNGANGFFITSQITKSAPGNGFLPYDAPSITFMQISSNTGNTFINNNGLNGILAQYPGGNHDILVEGDVVHATPQYGTFIQGNGQNGILSQAGIEGNVVMTVDRVLVGGPLAINANKGNGIDFEVQSLLHIVDGATYTNWIFNAAGIGTLNVMNSTIQGNLGNGIALIGNDLTTNDAGVVPINADGSFGTRSQNTLGDGWGQLSANITNNQIIQNGLNGVDVQLLGRMGLDRTSLNENAFVFTGNTISSNGQYGFFMESNTARDTRGGANPLFYSVDFFDPQPTNPPGPFDPNNLIGLAGWNQGNRTDLLYGFLQSNWMNLFTDTNSSLVFSNNIVQFNGKQGDLQAADGVFIRVSTNSYLSADIQNNTMSGNVANDLHIESFDAYSPITGVAPQPTGSVARGAPALDTVVLDDTAQLDLRLVGNIGNTINIVDPLVNYAANGALPGNTTPNGAVYAADPLKDNFSFTNPSPRVVQLFQVDNGPSLNSTNYFNQNGTTQDLNTLFINADWHLRAAADPLFPNPLFPQDYAASPGNPFLP